MAHTVTVTPLLAGAHRSIYHIGLVSDGISGDLNSEIIITPAMLGLKSSARLAIESVEYNFTGFNGILEFDSGIVDDNLIWALNSNLSSQDFLPYGGLKDPSNGDGTGNILFSTDGLSSLGSVGTMILKIRNS